MNRRTLNPEPTYLVVLVKLLIPFRSLLHLYGYLNGLIYVHYALDNRHLSIYKITL